MRDQPEHPIPIHLHHSLVLLSHRSNCIHSWLDPQHVLDWKSIVLGVLPENVPKKLTIRSSAFPANLKGDGIPGQDQECRFDHVRGDP